MSDTYYVDVPDGGWVLGSGYITLFSKYDISCPEDRTCQVGMGVMAYGKPRGEKVRFSGKTTITVVFYGQLHFRVDDGKGPCRVSYRESVKGTVSH